MRFVVLHTPGENWQMGIDYREQAGVMEHVNHYRQLHEQGKLEMGGPFLAQDRGGMMITIPDLSREEIEIFAADDPAVKSGLLRYEILPWYTPMERD